MPLLNLDEVIPEATIWTSVQVPDFTQTPVINIRFDSVSNQCSTAYGSYTFSLLNNSSFGGRITYQNAMLPSMQQLVFPKLLALRRLTVTLLDCDQQPLRTVQGNSNDIEVLMELCCYEE